MRALGLLSLLAACHSFDPPGQSAQSAHPVSNAGTGSFYPLGTTVTLDGTRSSAPDGAPLTYSWSVTQRPGGSTAAPVDPSAVTTTFVLDQLGTFRFQLLVSDDTGITDTSDLRIVSTGAITAIDAGSNATVPWLATAQLAGTVSTAPNEAATYSWSFLSQPNGSTSVIKNGDTLRPTFFADAAGTYVLALDATVGDEVREDTVSIDVNGNVGVAIGSGAVAYAYSTYADRILYVHDVGHAELVEVDPATGTKAVLNVGAFTPTSVAVDQTAEYVAIGGLGKIGTADLQHLTATGVYSVPGCTAKSVAMESQSADCLPFDGSTTPISSVNLITSAVTQTPCPVNSPEIAVQGGVWYLVDDTSPDLYVYSGPSKTHITHAGIAPPVIPLGTSFPSVFTGNGLVFDSFSESLLYTLPVPTRVSAGGAQRALNGELAVLAGSALKVFGPTGNSEPPLLMSAVMPPLNGMTSTTKLVAYSADGHRLIVVAGTSAGDVAYTVPR